MATYYINWNTGSDSNNGLSIATAWKTIGKAVSANNVFPNQENTYYIAAGHYPNFTTNFTLTGITTPSRQYFVGDTNGAIFGNKGQVVVSPWNDGTVVTDLNANPTTVNSAASLRPQHGNLTFQNITFWGSSGANRTAVATFNGWASGLQFLKCAFIGGPSQAVNIAHSANDTQAGAFTTPRNCLFENCVFMSAGAGLAIQTFFNNVANFDLGLTLRNCLFVVGNQGVRKDAPTQPFTGAGYTLTAGGGTMVNSTCVANREGIWVAAGNSTAFPFRLINNCITLSQNVGVNAGASGVITGQRNRIVQNLTNSSNYTGTNDITGGIVGLDALTGLLHNTGSLEFFMPSVSGVLQGQGITSAETPSVDILGYTRPSPISIGALEANSLGSGPLVGGKLIQ